MVTDSLRAKYCPPGGGYQLGGHDIVIGEDGLARLAGTDTIAGSTLHMNKGLQILVEEAMIPFHKPILKQIHVKEAYLTALSITSNKDAVICCGSLYMIGTLRNYISLHSEVLL